MMNHLEAELTVPQAGAAEEAPATERVLLKSHTQLPCYSRDCQLLTAQ